MKLNIKWITLPVAPVGLWTSLPKREVDDSVFQTFQSSVESCSKYIVENIPALAGG